VTRRGVLAVWLLVSGCGYHFAGAGTTVPSGARTLSIALFGNRTREHGLEVNLRRKLAEEFRRRGPLELVSDRDGDVLLAGTIRHFSTIPVASTANSEAVQFQGVIQISFRLTERTTGRLLYENKLLQESLDFGAVNTVVVTSSPRFQRGTIDSRDLAQMTNVQLGETRRRETLDDLLELLARDIYLQSMEGF